MTKEKLFSEWLEGDQKLAYQNWLEERYISMDKKCTLLSKDIGKALSNVKVPKEKPNNQIGDFVEVYVPMFGKGGVHKIIDIQNGYAIFDISVGKIQLEYCTKK